MTDPLGPDIAAMMKVLSLKAALTDEIESTVTLQIGLVPEHLPDQPAKVELAAGVALRVTTVPASKVAPGGSEVIVPSPDPNLVRFKGYRIRPAWNILNVRSATVSVPSREESPKLSLTK